MSLRFAILGLLAEGPQSGYQLHKSFDGSVGYFWEAKFQQVYGELRRLEAAALVERQAGPRGARPRKAYAITPAGERALDAWLDAPSPLPPIRVEFLVKVFSFGRVPAERAQARIVEHRRLHAQRLATYRDLEARLAESGVSARAGVPTALRGRYLTLRCGIAYEEAMLAWCDEAAALLERAPAGPVRRTGPAGARSRYGRRARSGGRARRPSGRRPG